jgi:RNA polymerase sigma-70 factor (ECF subfamily)
VDGGNGRDGAGKSMAETADRERLTFWVREYGDGLFRYLRFRVRDEHAAADLVQEVFFRAWRKRFDYVHRGQDRAYLFTVADRLACDHLRRPNRVAPLSEADEPSALEDPASKLLLAEAEAAVKGAIELLSEAQQRTLLLRYYGELSFQQIAEALDAPVGTVLSHCRRGLERLRESLTGELT